MLDNLHGQETGSDMCSCWDTAHRWNETRKKNEDAQILLNALGHRWKVFATCKLCAGLKYNSYAAVLTYNAILMFWDSLFHPFKSSLQSLTMEFELWPPLMGTKRGQFFQTQACMQIMVDVYCKTIDVSLFCTDNIHCVCPSMLNSCSEVSSLRQTAFSFRLKWTRNHDLRSLTTIASSLARVGTKAG